MADYTLLDLIPSFAHHEHATTHADSWNQVLGGFHPMLNPGGHIHMSHVVLSLLVLVICVVMALMARKKYQSKDEALIPEGKLSVRNFFETIFDGLYGMMENMMGAKHARQFFPLIAALAVYIFVSNLFGLIPGLAPPTQNLNTNLACSIVVFVFYNYVGIREHGLVNYLKHFLGPLMLIAPLMLVIELIGHSFRPVSLAVRLGGNMTGDHTVLGVFGTLAEMAVGVPILLPIPFLFLGLLVSIIQALVFCLLSSSYIAMAVAHDDHH